MLRTKLRFKLIIVWLYIRKFSPVKDTIRSNLCTSKYVVLFSHVYILVILVQSTTYSTQLHMLFFKLFCTTVWVYHKWKCRISCIVYCTVYNDTYSINRWSTIHKREIPRIIYKYTIVNLYIRMVYNFSSCNANLPIFFIILF